MSEPSALPGAGSEAIPGRDERLVAAPLLRRMAAFMYEGVLLFGVVAVSGTVYGVLAHQTSGIEKRTGLMAVCFIVVGFYFIWMWTRAGQTLPMRTWHLRLVTMRGLPITPRRALARYLACWIWFVPPLALAGTLHLPNAWAIFGLVIGWIVAYALSALLHPSRQFWHDWLCDTAIVTARPVAPLPQ